VERGDRKKRTTRPKSPLWQQDTNHNGWEALRESEAKFRDLYDNAPGGYHEYEREGRITKVNRTDLEMLGYTEEEITGHSIRKFNDLIKRI
jgi:PAS domain-containing protein